MKKKKSKIAFTLIAALVVAMLFVPWKQWAELGIKSVLATKGYPHADLTLESLSAKQMVLHDVSLGGNVPLTFEILEFQYTPETLKASKATLAEAVVRWQGGTLSTKNAALDWAGNERLKANVEVKDVPFGPLMETFTGGRAKATGMVSGKLPITAYADGTFIIRKGSLTAGTSGVFSVSPDLIPGDNEQIIQVRAALADFHYSTLFLTLDSDKDKKLSMLLQLYGNNPNVYNGREIKLNVRLQGDLLSLVQQSILPMTDPKQLLKQE